MPVVASGWAVVFYGGFICDHITAEIDTSQVSQARAKIPSLTVDKEFSLQSGTPAAVA